jgi:serine/threonine protein kinase
MSWVGTKHILLIKYLFLCTGEMFVAKSARATTPGALAQKNAKSYLEIESCINSKLLRPRSSKDAVYQKHLAPFLGETEINQTKYLIWHKSGEYTLEDYIEMDDGWVQLAKDLRLGDCNRVLLHQKLAKEVLRQLLEGVAYCHSLGVIHRDIKVKVANRLMRVVQ